MRRFIDTLCIVFCLLASGFYLTAQETTSINTTIEFVVNSDVIVKNDSYYKFIQETLPFLRDKSDEIENIVLIGSASPEGKQLNNIHLANIRAEKLCSIVSVFLPDVKITVNNDYSLFLLKTGLDETDYPKLRATYFEAKLVKKEKPSIVRDTIYISKTDTVFKQSESFHPVSYGKKPILSVYNDLLGDMLFRANIGAEVYFNKMSFFIEGSFSDWNIFGKAYDIDLWHIGFRKYFNNAYEKLFIEIYGNVGYFNTNLFNAGKIGVLYGGGVGTGYAFSIGKHWKISPIIRIGLFERIYYSDYNPGGSGNIIISFGNYIDWKKSDTGNTIQGNNNNTGIVNNTISKEFFEHCNKAYYIGPTYVGITLKRDFYIREKNKKKNYEEN